MSLFEFFSTLGIFSITLGQSLMILVGLLLLYLAINKKFEPLLLLPIGFGALLTNIPEIGLSMSPIEKLVYAANRTWANGVVSEVKIEKSPQHGYILRSTKGDDERALRESNKKVRIISILKVTNNNNIIISCVYKIDLCENSILFILLLKIV